MDDIMLNILSLAGFLTIGGMFYLLYRKNQQEKQQVLIDLAFQKGWQIQFINETMAKGFRLETPQWTLESMARSNGAESGPGSSNIEQTTKWSSPISGSTIIIGPKYSQMPIDPSIAPLIKKMMVADMGAEANHIHEFPGGSSSFQHRFMVWASDLHEMENLLTPSLQSALLTWTKVPPLIKRNSAGITIELKGIALKKPAEIESLVKLGERFL